MSSSSMEVFGSKRRRMVDREIKEDLPALLTRVTRRQTTRSDASLTSGTTSTSTSAATIIKRPLTTTTASGNKPSKKEVKTEGDLPTLEQYESLKTGRSPYLCVPCDKSFTRSSISSHVKTKHKGKNTKVNCLFCSKKFDRHSKAQDHVTSEHKVYTCKKEGCDEAFSEFERLKGHLKSAHNKAEWPWICGFCDQVLFYDLEFQVHIKKHTDSAPFSCALCAETFVDTTKVRQHLAEKHLPKTDDEKSVSVESEKSKTIEASTEQQTRLEALVQFRRKTESLSKDFVDKKDKTSKIEEPKMKDENAVNREIAALLLNLHASRGGVSVPKVPVVPKPEDLSLKNVGGNDSAMDLTKSKPLNTLNSQMPATITKLVKSHTGVDLSSGGKNNKTTNQVSAAPTTNLPNFTLPTAPTSYPFYSSLATMAGMSPSLAMNSNYLLQNLLLGKMQQIVSASSSSISPPSIVTAKTSSSSGATLSVPATSLPTHPLPAQSLSMASNTTSLKPPPAVFKTTSVPHTSSGGSAPNFTNPMTLTSGVGGETTTTTVTAATAASIPLLCGQIVSQLNGLLFLVHGINSPSMEMNLQTQLTAIHTRLQDIVSMVEHAKKSDPDLKGDSKSSKENHKQKEEEKIVAKHIQDYQRALLKQHEDNTKVNNGVQQQQQQQQHNNNSKNNLVVDLPEGSPSDSMEMQEAESTSGYLSAAARRRRGRPPKNSNLDLSYSPPEKQMRSSSGNPVEKNHHHQQHNNSDSAQHNGEMSNGGNMLNGNNMTNLQQNGNGNSNNTGSMIQAAAALAAAAAGKGGSSKGIRNRVFCGECGGCLKNDDCGKCRYCKDKTKFGGQNRLRQKCLHRRCQMDTHRRRSSHNNQNAAAATNAASAGDHNNDHNNLSYESARQSSPSPNGIYSGVDLARLAAVGQQQQQHLAAVAIAAAAAKLPADDDKHHSVSNLESYRNGEKSLAIDRSASSASNGSATSGDEDGDDQKTGKSQSRIDKWKAKHEAMLKLAQKTDKTSKSGKEESKDISSNATNDDILSLDPSAGVCIDFDDHKDVGSKPHTRHTATLQQQALSV